MVKFKYTVEDATRRARAYVIERTGFHPTAKDVRAFILDARENIEASHKWRDEHGEFPRYRDLEPKWERAHATRLYTRRDGYPYCAMQQGICDLGLNDVREAA